MPYKRKRFGKAKKRTFRRKHFRRGGRTTMINRSFKGPVAPRLITKLKYNSFYSYLTSGIDRVWYLNSIFDPDASGAGHQPYGRDTLAVLYNRYRVYKCEYIIAFTTYVANASYYCGVLANNDGVLFTNLSLASESPTAVTKIVAQGKPAIFKGSFRLPSITGVTSKTYKSDDRYQAQFAASPAEVICLHTFAAELSGAAVTTNGDIRMNITLIYHTECFDPLAIAQS